MIKLGTCILLAATLSACGKPDDCQRAAAALMRAMKDTPMPSGKSSGDMKDMVIAQCRKEPDAFKKDKDMQCVIASKTEGEEDACLKSAFGDYTKKSKKSEAELQLNKLAKNLKVYAVEKAAFPIGTAKTLPASPDANLRGCCGGKSDGTNVNNKCSVSTDWATDPVWQQLDFQVDEPGNYRYSYESADGKTFKATAAGDLDCDNNEAVYTLTGKLDASGNPTTDLASPAAGQY